MKLQRAEQLKTIVYNNYQNIAANFSATRQQAFWPELRQLLQSLPLKGNLLDIGCGNGRLVDELKNRPLSSYTGSDLSEKLLEIAKKNHPTTAFHFPLNWQVGDLLTTPTQQYQTVCCIAALHHIPSRQLRQQAATNLAASLRDNGYLIVSVWDLYRQIKYWPKLFFSFWAQFLGQLDYGDLLFHWGQQKTTGSLRYYHAFTKKEAEQLLTATGLKLITYRHDNLNHYFVLQKVKN